jgi:hypothetical protein
MPASATTCDGDEFAIDEQSPEGVLKCYQFGVAADHPRGDAFDAAAAVAKAACLGSQHEIRLDDLIHALDGQRLLPLDLEQATHLRIGIVTDAQRSSGRGLLHACGDVHCDAAECRCLRRRRPEQYAAGMDADADVEAFVAMSGLHFGAECPAEVEQREGRTALRARRHPHGPPSAPKTARMLFAGVLQHLARMYLDDRRSTRQCIVHDGADRFRVEVAGRARSNRPHRGTTCSPA